MLIRETFATTIQERIEPVVKVAERRPAVLLNELSNLVVTSQWEQHLRRLIAKGRAFGVVHQGGWCDVGHPAGILEAEALLKGAHVS